MLTYTTTIDIRDGNPFILIPKHLATKIKPGWRKPLPVIIKVNGHPKEGWQINMMPAGNGDFYLYLHGDVRKVSNTKVGDTVTVTIVFDQAYKNGPQHPLPAWFGVALEKHPVAQQNWNALPPSRQKEILRYFSWLKSDAAKQRNLDKALYVLSGKSGRFMARQWENGK